MAAYRRRFKYQIFPYLDDWLLKAPDISTLHYSLKTCTIKWTAKVMRSLTVQFRPRWFELETDPYFPDRKKRGGSEDLYSYLNPLKELDVASDRDTSPDSSFFSPPTVAMDEGLLLRWWFGGRF
ncbi:hypothetical protein NDU88_006604 [Pleurodeles waltl]|uniref:Uncharacterized protein n=1 Tax=Pleurodeles waltl TaxID=8319 RepID=A0AAV7VRV3_PLEWA|nr:hypothetical protein NDU88_006604 [Pleurodeles waltl]